ncbi:deoxyribose-phosphate aldolase [Ihubacter sp. rT4E-8]|uniref:deoxyribose-phosphate aldolase n=1 Tax=unclassified Ihubacter TaxID=2633299 RepID=UPI003C7A2DEE
MKINTYIDHTLLRPDASEADIANLCAEAISYQFSAVCVNSCYVSLAARLLSGTNISIASVIGFPLGAMSTASKAFEAEDACINGASEIDMVLNIGKLKDGDEAYVEADVRAVVKAAEKYGGSVKVILETCLLNDDEIIRACQLAEAAGAHFVKTSTGFSTGGAEARHVALMRSCVGNRLGVKASGGIRNLETVKTMIKAGANRIGASAGVTIMKEAAEQENTDF